MELSPEDKHRAAMACRAAAYQAEKDGEAQSNPGVKATFRREAEAYKALAERLEGTRDAITAPSGPRTPRR